MTNSAAALRQPTCCGRRMSSITVSERGSELVLHSCPTCARHVWVRDGVVASREDLMAGVQVVLAQPRIPTPRKRKAPATAA